MFCYICIAILQFEQYIHWLCSLKENEINPQYYFWPKFYSGRDAVCTHLLFLVGFLFL